ncbi:Transcription intermediary factor 1-alpha [Wickerhamomyces ciferrii]|uniref:Transcription intermediary factor 1-alpha n=1 Tax=Wickerhamomyces ciferrii (strain ATCC 14091 / BCRC 22168 / CBS 111 / JCM 3599 / NBRC 0793 / NRRL Y-1031 F-60-10) TaxID=1206466 RepID=K0KBT4_WICCF|nr:Transcription intermediary factor 1-alpha [Wickerhamomyces ciferrii]CCH42525.1 Transcription intermediary factor 1-alpha [Wickerhamomyces ciferrii]
MSGREVVPLHQYEAFRILVLRVIESFVYKSLDETISLLKITTVINNNPLAKLVRLQISPGRTASNLPKVTIRDVILSITKIFQSSDIQILANNDNFKIKLTRNDFQALVDKHFGRYIENSVESIRDFEDDHDKVLKEIIQIEKGELDQVIIQEHRQTLAQRQQLQQQQQQLQSQQSKQSSQVPQTQPQVQSQAQPLSQAQPQVQQQAQPQVLQLQPQPQSQPQQQRQQYPPVQQIKPSTSPQAQIQSPPTSKQSEAPKLQTPTQQQAHQQIHQQNIQHRASNLPNPSNSVQQGQLSTNPQSSPNSQHQINQAYQAQSKTQFQKITQPNTFSSLQVEQTAHGSPQTSTSIKGAPSTSQQNRAQNIPLNHQQNSNQIHQNQQQLSQEPQRHEVSQPSQQASQPPASNQLPNTSQAQDPTSPAPQIKALAKDTVKIDKPKANQTIIPIKKENNSSNQVSNKTQTSTQNSITETDNKVKGKTDDENTKAVENIKDTTQDDAVVVIDDDEDDDLRAPTPEATTPEPESTEEPKSGKSSVRLSPRKGKSSIKDNDSEQEEHKSNESSSGEEDDEENGETERRSTRSQTGKRRKSVKDEDDKDTPVKKKTKYNIPEVPSSPGGPIHAPPNKKLQILSNPLIANISSYKYASTFSQPVQESNAPDYYDIIKEPRDLKTIRQMIKDGRIQTSEQLERDILLMFANAIMYNKTGSDVYEWSKEMQVETDNFLQLFKESENN